MELYTPRSSGVLSMEGRFISLRHVKEALEESCNVKTSEETPNSFRGKISHLGKVYLPPIFGPEAIIEITIDKDDQKLFYTLFWPEYYVIIFTVLVLFIVSRFINMPLAFYVIVTVFHLFLIFIETFLVKSLVKRCLLSIQKSP